MLKTKLVTTLAAVIGLLALAAPAHATEAPPAYSLFAWHITSTTGDNFATPQEYITHLKTDSLDLDQLLPLLPCGTKVQLDGYLNNATSDALIGGKLYGPGNPTEPWPGGQYQSSYSRVLTTPECVPPAEPNPAASIATACLTASTTLTNDLGDAADRLTASAVVYIDGQFHEALTALGGETVNGTAITLPANTGKHVVTIRTGPAFGDVLLAEAEVATDTQTTDAAAPCYVAPPVVNEPPTTPTSLPVTGVEPVGGLIAALALILSGLAVPFVRRRISA